MPTACNNNLYSYKELEEEHVLILVASSEFLDFIVFFSIYNTFSCLKFILFNWRIIALQCCVAFCHTSTWISQRYTQVPSLLNLLPTPPFQVAIEHQVDLPASYSKFPLSIYFTYGNVPVSKLLSQFIPPSPSITGSTSLFSVYISTAALQIGFISTIFLDLGSFFNAEIHDKTRHLNAWNLLTWHYNAHGKSLPTASPKSTRSMG